MTHRFPIKEIARQAGVGLATVDRVLNERPNVSPQTRNRVAAAIRELEGQEAQLAARGRRLFVDFVVEAPKRFSDEIQRAAEAVLPTLGTAVFRPRFVCQEIMSEDEVVQALDRVRRKGSQGVCVKARDLPEIRKAISALVAQGIPVVTLVTDVPLSERHAYVGLDNRNAGRTAAFLVATAMSGQIGTVLACRSQEEFYGEAERFEAFRSGLEDQAPRLQILDVSGGAGVAKETRAKVEAAVESNNSIGAVYSMGGGNKIILDVLRDHGIRDIPYVAHDLDAENTRLLEEGHLSFVLHHDLESDMRSVFQTMAAAHGLAPKGATPLLSDIEVVTRFNRPVRQAVF